MLYYLGTNFRKGKYKTLEIEIWCRNNLALKILWNRCKKAKYYFLEKNTFHNMAYVKWKIAMMFEEFIQ